MNYFSKFWLSCLAMLMAMQVMGQASTIRGYVLERGSQMPLGYAEVQLLGHDLKAFTNGDGFFQFNDVPVGKHTIQVLRVGYAKQTRKVNVKYARASFERFLMDESTIELVGVVVNAKRQEQQTKVATASVQLSPKSIAKFSIGGEPDLVRALQVLPGVITTGDQGGQLYIRGGAPIQNLIKLDGMILYNPFHSIGFFSVFDTDILQKADIYTAGFGAKYGGRTSSVMDIKTRTGNRERIAGKVTASTYMAKLLLELPIGDPNDQGLAPSSLLISTKKSYLDKVAPYIYPHATTQYGGIPFQFEDLYMKYTVEADGGSKLNVYGFDFNDAVSFSGNKTISWHAVGQGAEFLIVPPSSATLIEGHLATSSYKILSTELENRPRDSEISGFNGGLDFTYLLRDHDEFQYGLEFIGYRTDYHYTNTVGRQFQQLENTPELAAYMDYKMEVGRWLIQPGFRIHNYGSLAITRMEPRLGAKVNVTEHFRLKASAGKYSQNLVAANSDRDVVNLFYGFLSGDTDLPSRFNGQLLHNKLQTADHVVVGMETNLTDRWTLEIETYAKRFNQITNINRYKIYDDIPAYDDKPELLKKDFIVESGMSKGLDFLLTYEDKHWYLWTVYSYGKVTRWDGVVDYPPHYDRRHNANLVVSYTTDKDWVFNLRWNYGSGFPFTPIKGYYELLPFTEPDGQPFVDYTYPRSNGQMGILYGDLNSQRLPDYYRMDVTISKSWNLANHQILDLSFAATNVTNRANIFYYDTPKAQRVNQLPIMPTLMLGYAF